MGGGFFFFRHMDSVGGFWRSGNTFFPFCFLCQILFWLRPFFPFCANIKNILPKLPRFIFSFLLSMDSCVMTFLPPRLYSIMSAYYGPFLPLLSFSSHIRPSSMKPGPSASSLIAYFPLFCGTFLPVHGLSPFLFILSDFLINVPGPLLSN